MDKLDELKQEYESKVKQVALAESGISLDDLERYERYLIGDDEDVLREQAEELMRDINGDSQKGNDKKKTFKL